MNTYYELIKNLKDIFEEDIDVQTVICESDDTSIDNYKKNLFPLVHINVIDSPFTGVDNTASTQYNVEVTVVAVRDVNKEIINDKFWLNDNRHDNWNLTRAILKKAQNKVVKDTLDTDITLSGSSNADILSFQKSNTLDGWQQTWIIDVPDSLTTLCSTAVASADDFIIKVKTDNAGTSNNDQFTLPMITGAYDVDWGDGNTDLAQSGTQTHTYSSSGTYEIVITGGTHLQFIFGGDAQKLIDILNWGTVAWTSFDNSFGGCSQLGSLTASDVPDLSNVTTFRRCFRASSVSTIPNINLWQVNTLTVLEDMFHSATNFNEDISSWDINQVTSFTNFMLGVTLSTANYDALLIAWDAQGAMSYSGTVNFGSSTYTSGGAAETARTSLISKWGAITDGGAA